MGLRWLFLLGFSILLSSCSAESKNFAQETGPAAFLRDFDQAAALSKKTNKPIFAFFQEVPG
ncbi:hypothetical protein SAMN02745181_2914 [Rubritalea squalenifaciens DSM 18772]|uniref:Uncharacterized protein n=3 Tax=Rubritalea squalenifaciens TaxID=407226 RepID=A0A1M6NNK5_9BACT|nr:hypothetical protein SAMN02745181_2914 [Rubritalea squalenifaciens DSM 18772]